MHCLDSDFIIEVLRGEPGAVALQRALQRTGRPRVSAVTAFELTDNAWPARRAVTMAALGALDILPVDGSVALAASQLSTELRRRGRAVPMADLLIAATCLLHGLRLVTRNRRHFGRVPGLQLLAW